MLSDVQLKMNYCPFIQWCQPIDVFILKSDNLRQKKKNFANFHQNQMHQLKDITCGFTTLHHTLFISTHKYAAKKLKFIFISSSYAEK